MNDFSVSVCPKCCLVFYLVTWVGGVGVCAVLIFKGLCLFCLSFCIFALKSPLFYKMILTVDGSYGHVFGKMKVGDPVLSPL